MTARPVSAGRNHVKRNRESILQAARAIFAATPHAPMYEVARHAGVGQATLYRHFPDRLTLLAVIVADDVDQIELARQQCSGSPEVLADFIRATVHLIAERQTLAFVTLGRDTPGGSEKFDEIRARCTAMFSDLLAEARRTKTVRADLTTDDMYFIIDMAAGPLTAIKDPTQRRHTVERVLALIMPGIRPPAADNG